jgi:alkanesulfonate monooxygenase SsuD/methylene tetrahydromethanopterin reductase-like flavin-dependent oxidoreductase (luciferase family)
MPEGEKLLFGIGAPQIHADLPPDVEEIQSYIRRAEELDFHSLWVQEQVDLRQAWSALEGIALMSYMAALTRRIRLGTAVFLINLRNPIHLAKSLATLDQLSHGRVIAGVGLGAPLSFTAERKTTRQRVKMFLTRLGYGSKPVMRLYSAYGLSSEKRVARFNETLTVIQKLWTEDNVTFKGRFWDLRGATVVPKPFQKPHPPLWFGANAPTALRRAVKRGSGFIGAGSSSTADFKNNVQVVRASLAQENKNPAEFMIGKRVYIAVDKNRDQAFRSAQEWFAGFYGKPDLAARVVVYGTPDECVEKLGEVVSAGARFLLLNPMSDLRNQMEILAGEVIPKLRNFAPPPRCSRV